MVSIVYRAACQRFSTTRTSNQNETLAVAKQPSSSELTSYRNPESSSLVMSPIHHPTFTDFIFVNSVKALNCQWNAVATYATPEALQWRTNSTVG